MTTNITLRPRDRHNRRQALPSFRLTTTHVGRRRAAAVPMSRLDVAVLAGVLRAVANSLRRP